MEGRPGGYDPDVVARLQAADDRRVGILAATERLMVTDIDQNVGHDILVPQHGSWLLVVEGIVPLTVAITVIPTWPLHTVIIPALVVDDVGHEVAPVVEPRPGHASAHTRPWSSTCEP